MTVADAAKQLEITPSGVYKLCRAGVLGCMRIGVGRGGAIRITQEDVDRFKAEARAKAVPPKPEPAAPFEYRHFPPPE